MLAAAELERELTTLAQRFETVVHERDALARERDEYKRLAELLRKELERLRDAQKTPREHVDRNELQLVFAEMLRHISGETTAPLPAPPAPSAPAPRRRTPHGRALLPENLPVETVVLEVATAGKVIAEEVSWRLGFRRGGFYRLKIVRPIVVLDANQADEATVAARLEPGDFSCLPRPASAGNGPPQERTEAEQHPVAALAPLGDEAASPAAFAPTPPPAVAAGLEPRSGGAPRDTTVVCASAPDEMIPRGLPSVDLLAHVLCAKFADKSPFRRQEGIYAREGVHLSAATMCGWACAGHELARHVVGAMIDDALTNAHWIATDSTGVLVQANQKCRRGHYWVFVSDNGHVVFRYSPKCSKQEPLAFFGGFRGKVIADASSVYDALFRLPDGPTESGCWAHARRYFYKALPSDRERALGGIGFANKLFELERELAKLPPSTRLRLRQERAGPVIAQFERWRTEMLAHPEVAEGTAIRRALQYTVNHWDALCRFLHDGRIPIHNNRSELELRRLVIGRANWLFVGSDESAAWTGTFSSLVASCSLHGLDPEAYLRDLFRVLPLWPRPRLLELAPRCWAATRARLDPAELALPLGPLTVPPLPTP